MVADIEKELLKKDGEIEAIKKKTNEEKDVLEKKKQTQATLDQIFQIEREGIILFFLVHKKWYFYYFVQDKYLLINQID